MCRTRRYERAFLHAKAYIFDGLAQGFIAGSSNLTRAGLTTNLELNLGRWDAPVFGQARDWFKSEQAQGEEFLRHATQIKNIWVPYGE